MELRETLTNRICELKYHFPVGFQSTQSAQAASPSSMEASGPPAQQINLPGSTPTTPWIGFTSSMGREAFGFGTWTPQTMQTFMRSTCQMWATVATCGPRKLWKLNTRPPVLEQVGPVGSFIRHMVHANPMVSPNLPRHARTGHWPVRNFRDLNTFPGIENAMVHRRYFEQLSFEAQALHQCSRMIAERIQDEPR